MHIGDRAGQHSRVALMVSNDSVIVDTQLDCAELMALKNTGLWKECVIYCGDGSTPIIIANMYGMSEATSSACVKIQNEAMLRVATLRAVSS